MKSIPMRHWSVKLHPLFWEEFEKGTGIEDAPVSRTTGRFGRSTGSRMGGTGGVVHFVPFQKGAKLLQRSTTEITAKQPDRSGGKYGKEAA